MGYIYALQNKINNKIYIGQTTKSVEDRLRDHKIRNSAIGNAIRKYGLENFDIRSIECAEEHLDFEEIKLIYQLNTLVPNGYNLETGGNKNKHLSDETKEKIRKSRIGNKYRLGKKLSEESKNLIGIKSKGRIPSVESRLKMSISGKNKYKGKINPCAKKVICVETGEIFNSMKDANDKYNLTQSCVSNCCRKRRGNNTAGGYHWEYYKCGP
jgi:group I intron endonuclease